MTTPFRRDRLTWLAYLLLAWYAYLQAAPGLVVPHLRDELGLSYWVGGLHVAAFAAGSILAGLVAAPLERALGRRRLLWSAAVVMAVGAVGLGLGRAAAVTIGSVLVMGVGGGLLLVTIQALLADHHGRLRTVALAEANLSASIAYLALTVVLSLMAAVHLGWRAALAVSLLTLGVLWWTNRRVEVATPTPTPETRGHLPAVVWVAAAMLVCTSAAEWSVTAWGASFVKVSAQLSADRAVLLMAGYFAGVLAGRVISSRLARRYDPALLLGLALAISIAGFAVLWPSTTQAQALLGLAVLGVGIGNLFPMAVSVAVALAPAQAVLVSGRVVAVSSIAILVAPPAVGALADATSLRTALCVVPVALVLASVGLAVVRRVGAATSVAGSVGRGGPPSG